MTRRFPSGFLWGTAASAYQIEGAVDVDGRGPSVWDTFSHRPGATANGDTGDVACDHYHRYPEDIALMRRLGVAAYRLSTSWPRIVPDGTGAVDQRGLDFYDRVVDLLLHEGIQPWICLHHWDLPATIEERGGWRTRDGACWFADYCAVVARHFGDRVSHFVPINEPNVLFFFGYNTGDMAPGRQSRADGLKCIHHLNLAHGWAVAALRAEAPGAELGSIVSLGPVRAPFDDPAHRQAQALGDCLWRRAMVDPLWLGSYPEPIAREIEPLIQADDLRAIAAELDFFGINHYAPVYLAPSRTASFGVAEAPPPAGVPLTDIGWQIEPAAFREQLLEVRDRYGSPPIYVTENGCAAPDMLRPDRSVDDDMRIRYLHGYLGAMLDAMGQGCDVRGYFAWSLMDNFEWGKGYTKRFGLVYVDYPTLQRIPKRSYGWLQQVIAAAALP